MTINRDVANIASRTQKVRRPHVYPLIMNGDMRIAQRGTSFTGLSSGQTYTLDRFAFLVNEGAFTITQDTDVPTGYGFKHSLKIDCTTADDSLSADGDIQLFQRFEGQDLALLNKGLSSAEYITFSCWIKSTVTGNFVVELKDHDNSRTIGSLETINSADTWQKIVVAFPGDTSSGDPFTFDNGVSLDVKLMLGQGSDFTSGTLATSWADQVNANRAAGQTVNIASSTDNNFLTTGWQLEVGQYNSSNIPDFQFVDQATQLMQCQRYAQIFVNGNAQSMGYGVCYQADAVFVDLHYKNIMRTTPTAVLTTSTNYWAINSGNATDTFDSWSGVASQTHPNGGMLFCDGNNLSVTKGHTGDVYSNNAAAKIVISADL